MVTILFLRLALAWIFIYEGTGKLYGWFAGSGIESVTQYFYSLGIPFAKFSAYLVGYAELLCGLCFLAGFLVRIASAGIAIIMLVAIFTAHRQGGFNFPLLVFSACALLLESGAGKFSLDRYLGKLRKRQLKDF